jgi:hypothetical protein
LNEAVDVLISKIGTDKKLTNLLIDYSLDKTDDDKSWDISKDLNDFARILLNEDDVKHFRELAGKELDDFFNSMTQAMFENLQKFFICIPRLKNVIEVENPITKVTSTMVLEGLGDFLG